MAEYNGWKNYETWLVNIWYGDNYNEYFLEQFREGDLLSKVSAAEVRDHVESYLELDGTLPSGLVTDLLGNAMSKVDWHRLAEHVEEMLQYEMENAA
tara:strand:- start:902 stop:1192 length:291 start_codon:yes stop_codon:yes gene_type:complete